MCSLTICCSSIPDFTLSVAGRGGEQFYSGVAGSPGQLPHPQHGSPALQGGKSPPSPPQQTGRAAAVASVSPRSPFKRAIVHPMRLLAMAGDGAKRIKQWLKITRFPPDAPLQQPLGLGAMGRGRIFAALRYFLPWRGCVFPGPKCRRGGQPRARSR